MRNLKKLLAGFMALMMCLMLTIVMSSAAAPTLTSVSAMSGGATAPYVNNTVEFTFDIPITNVDWTKVKVYSTEAKNLFNEGTIVSVDSVIPGGLNMINAAGNILDVRYLDGTNGSSANQIVTMANDENVTKYVVLEKNAINGDSPVMYGMLRGNSWNPLSVFGEGMPQIIKDFKAVKIPKITKTLELEAGVTVPLMDFNFTFTPLSYDETDTSSTRLATFPTISQTLGFTLGGSNISTAALNLPANPTTAFGGVAGWYAYTVAEVDAGNDAVTYSGETYILYIGVINDGEGGLEYGEFKIKKLTDDEGAALTPAVKVTDIDFTNEYTPESKLSLEKIITGDYADMTSEFEFTITFDTTATNIKYYIGDTAPLDPEELLDFTNGGTMDLGHGDKVTFIVPAATDYTIVETGVTGYNQSINIDGTDISPFVALDGYEGTVLEEGSAAIWTNDFTITSPTGILIDNLPYIILIFIALIAVVGYFVIRRRKTA